LEKQNSDNAKLLANPNFRPGPDDTFAEIARNKKTVAQAQALWMKIDKRVKDVLTIMAQMAPPNAQELVEAFTGDP
jgi:hypothetical protein